MCYCSTTLQNTKETFYKGREREINLNSLSNILRAHPQWVAYRSGGHFCRPERSERVLPGRCKGRCKGDSAGGRRQGTRGGRTADQVGPARAPEQWARGRGDAPESAFRDRVIRSGARVRKDGPGEASGSSKRGDGTVMYSERGHKKRKAGGWASMGEGRRVRDTQIRRADTDSGVPPETGLPGRGDVGCEEGQEQIPELPR